MYGSLIDSFLSASAFTDHSQSTKDIDSYFKSQLYVKDTGHRNPVLILQNGLSKPGESEEHMTEISFYRGWDSNQQSLDRQT